LVGFKFEVQLRILLGTCDCKPNGFDHALGITCEISPSTGRNQMKNLK